MILVSFFLEDNVPSDEIQICYIFVYQSKEVERSAFLGRPVWYTARHITTSVSVKMFEYNEHNIIYRYEARNKSYKPSARELLVYSTTDYYVCVCVCVWIQVQCKAKLIFGRVGTVFYDNACSTIRS